MSARERHPTRPRRLVSALLALTLAALLPVAAAAAPVTIQVRFNGSAGGLNPADAAWNTATQYYVALDTVISTAGVPQLLPRTKWKYVLVKAYRNATDAFFRYQWADPSADADVSDTMLFSDAFAMEIPYGLNSSIAMGNQFEPVNILFWRADLPNPQNIVAGGAGTVQTSPDSGGPPPATPPLITHSQAWANGMWTVVIRRPLSGAASPQGNLVELVPRSVNPQRGVYRICFAQWDGGNQERDGVKLVAGSWQTLYIP